MSLRGVYYSLKPFMPRIFQLYLRRKRLHVLYEINRDIWPINPLYSSAPMDWPGWPGKKRFALVLTHDVEWKEGIDKCKMLTAMEESFALRSSFFFVPQRYLVSDSMREQLVKRGFEVGVHDLKHDGKLFSSRRNFLVRAPQINRVLSEWNAVGFRAGAMHHNLEWIGELDVNYDCSTFDTDPFEPQPDGVKTIFPFYVNRVNRPGGYVEIPYTIPQDFTVYILMRCKNIDIWSRKLDWIAKHGGMALINTHPDYINFDNESSLEEYPADHYYKFLEYVTSKYHGEYWNALPRDVANFVSNNSLAGMNVSDKIDTME
jgi:hypothetical protein